jgi:ABC-type sugar transport system substrate-binding protein
MAIGRYDRGTSVIGRISQSRCRTRRLGRAGSALELAIVMAIGLTTGCDRGDPTHTRPTRQPFVGFVGIGRDDPMWPILCAGAKQFLRQGGRMQVRFEAPERRSPSEQNRLIRRLLEEGMTTLCVHVVNPELIRPAIEQASKQGVPVFTMVRDAAAAFRTAFVGPDQEQLGRVLAETTLGSIEGSGTIAVVHAGPDDPLFGDRYRGFDREFRKQPRIRVLKSLNCKADPRTADRQLRDVLERYPRLKAVVLLANWPFMLPDRQPVTVPPGCRIISVGATPEYWDRLEDGTCFALVDAEYGKIGFQALLWASTAGRSLSSGDKQPSAQRTRVEHVPTRVVWATTLARHKLDWQEWATDPTSR